MSLIPGVTAAYTMAASPERPVQPVKIVPGLKGEERTVQPYKDPEPRTLNSGSTQLRTSTDTTGIVLSEETKQFLSTLSNESQKLPESPKQEYNTYTAKSVSYAPGTLASIPDKAPVTPTENSSQEPNSEEKNKAEGELSKEEQEVVRDLQARDTEVRAHEQAHLAASQGIAKGGANYSFTTGPDNKQYATGGSVQIDTSSESSDPEANLAKARQIRAAALAPASPSSQDMAVATQASAMEVQARQEKTKETQDPESEDTKGLSASPKNEPIGEEKKADSAGSGNSTENSKNESSPTVNNISENSAQVMMGAAGAMAVQNVGAGQANSASINNDKAVTNAQGQNNSFAGMAQTQSSGAVQALSQLANVSQNPQNNARSQGQEKQNTGFAAYAKMQNTNNQTATGSLSRTA